MLGNERESFPRMTCLVRTNGVLILKIEALNSNWQEVLLTQSNQVTKINLAQLPCSTENCLTLLVYLVSKLINSLITVSYTFQSINYPLSH